MIAVQLPYLFGYAVATEPLMNLPSDVEYGQVQDAILSAAIQIRQFHENSVYSANLRSSHPPAGRLLALLDNQISNFDRSRIFSAQDGLTIHFSYSEYKSALWAELTVLPAYFVTQKGNFDTAALIQRGEALFPLGMLDKVPESAADAKEAGKALAFELPTACGFHTWRVVEAVMRRYWDFVTIDPASGKPRDRPVPDSLGNVAAQLEMLKLGEEKIRSTVAQMAKLHRNPLAHPDIVLDLDEASGAIGMASSAVGQMLKALPILPPSTSA